MPESCEAIISVEERVMESRNTYGKTFCREKSVTGDNGSRARFGLPTFPKPDEMELVEGIGPNSRRCDSHRPMCPPARSRATRRLDMPSISSDPEKSIAGAGLNEREAWQFVRGSAIACFGIQFRDG
jgi:hypothetical protein